LVTTEYTGSWTARELSQNIVRFLSDEKTNTAFASVTTANVTVTDVIWGANSTLERVNFLFDKSNKLKQSTALHVRTFVKALAQFVPQYKAMDAIFDSQVRYRNALGLVRTMDRDAWYDAVQYAPGVAIEATPTKFCKTSACAIWVMMHAISVSIEPAATALLHTSQLVAETFPCKNCADHFNSSIWDPQSPLGNARVCDDGAILWLVAAHNDVNARLNKPRYPTALDCPHCISDQDVVDFTRQTYFIEPASIQAPSIYIGACALSGPIAALFLELGKRNGFI
jgi:hypothetical protein